MNRFMIGQYGSYDEAKYERDFRAGFWGVEACLFTDDQDLEKLAQQAELHKFNIGIHFPLRAGRSKLRDALFLAQDDTLRAEAYQLVQEELEAVMQLSPAYVLFHYPKPVILDDRVDWTPWRFSDPAEFVMQSEYALEDLVDKSEVLFQWLTDRGETYHFTPVLEFDALCPYLLESDYLVSLLERYPTIRLCLDMGRLFLQEQVDPNFNARAVIRKYAKYADVIHLWTLQYQNGEIIHYHYPVLPEQKEAEGWAPIADYLRIVREAQPHVNIQFEHQSNLISDEDLSRCYAWVEGMLRGEIA
ncbi:sugar phosphate isomerase/epimerase [Paenibacillus guangzhouensis]|uniref:sugar phosphate isomerase/epimerase n=1 Tax=Paenibacillus guangzhouensis TaxID=1473112 RepID=UPI001266B1B6|nr:sugar phosphate isomerase/epimerase [Paenibacillus guangzhouensis]